MKNQPNDMVTLEWLLPLFNEQLSQFANGWQVGDDAASFLVMQEQYHQIGGALVVANLPRLARLASKLSALAEVAHHHLLGEEYYSTGRFAHQLLQYELTQGVQKGSYRGSLVLKTVDVLTDIIMQAAMSEQTDKLSFDHSRLDVATRSTTYAALTTTQYVNIAVPITTALIHLQAVQYQQLLTVWRQQAHKLLTKNINQRPILALLEKVSHYLWQTTLQTLQQQLWYGTELWLQNLAQNPDSRPLDYAPLLTNLEHVIQAYTFKAEQEERQNKGSAKTDDTLLTTMPTGERLTPDMVESLVEDVYIELSRLPTLNAHTQSLLSHVPQSTEVTLSFLSRLLSEIETAIFGLDAPRTLIEPLQQIKRQLGMRGWTKYEWQVSDIIDDITASVEAESGFSSVKWQVEQQLQELYNGINETMQSIEQHIGDYTALVPNHSNNHNHKGLTSSVIISPDTVLPQLRVAVESIKQHFNHYIQQQDCALLPVTAAFTDVGSIFNDMGLPDVQQVVDKIGSLFDQISEHNIQVLGWQLTQALADGLSSIELLLEYLGQQVFDHALLAQIHAHVNSAETLLSTLISNPSDATLQDLTGDDNKARSLQQVVRYDDDGEIAPTELTDSVASDDDGLTDDMVVWDVDVSDNVAVSWEGEQPLELPTVHDDSPALQAVRDQLQADSFIDDIQNNESFITEASDTLEDANDFLWLWSQDRQDLTPLMEVQRGFQMLQLSAQSVGAFSVSEPALAIEKLLSSLLDHTLTGTDEIVDFIVQTTQKLTALVHDFGNQRSSSSDPAFIILGSNNILAGKSLTDGLNAAESLRYTDRQHTATVGSSVANNDEQDNQAISSGDDTQSAYSENDLFAEAEVVINDNDDSSESESTVSLADESSEGDEDSSGLSPTSVDFGLSDLTLPDALQPFVEKAEQLPADTQDADEDIKEIFIEEAEEVLAEITPLYHTWQQNPETLTTLQDIRRGFHTLKGSGRMVGAYHTGELAWAIEDMLNRILDKTIEATADIVTLIGDVLSAYPSLVEVFAQEAESSDESKDYPAIMSLWVVCANAYSAQLGDKFSYPDLHIQWSERADSDSEVAGEGHAEGVWDNNEVGDKDSAQIEIIESHVDNMLHIFQSVNEKMAEAPAIVATESQDEQDFCQIFVDEAQTLLQNINQFVTDNEHETQVEVSDEIVRAFHTLRAASGSSALVAISEVSAAIEQSLEYLQQQDIMMNAQHLQALTQSTTLIENYLLAYEQCVLQQIQPTDNNEENQKELTSLQTMLSTLDNLPQAASSKLSVAPLLNINIDGLLDADQHLKKELSTTDVEHIHHYISSQRAQIVRLSTQTAQSPKFIILLDALDHAYQYLELNPEEANDSDMQTLLLAGHTQLVSLFDSLAGSMSLKVDAQLIVDLQALPIDDELLSDKVLNDDVSDDVASLPVEDDAIDTELADDPVNDNIVEDEDLSDFDVDGIDAQSGNAENADADNEGADSTAVGDAEYPVSEAETIAESSASDMTTASMPILLRSVDSVQAESLQLEIIETDIELLEIFLEEAQEIDSGIAQTFSKWRTNTSDIATLKVLQRYLHTIKGGARMAGIRSIGDLTSKAENLYTAFIEADLQPTTQWLTVMQMVQDTLSLQIDYVLRYRESFFAQELIDQLQALQTQGELPITLTLVLPALQNHLNADEGVIDEADVPLESSAELVSLDTLITQSWSAGLPDLDILEVFLEEAEELVTSSEKYLQLFLNNISDMVALQTLQRDLHTIKGGARMVGANGIADLAHEMETVYEELAIRRRPATKMISQLLTTCHDWLADAVFVLKNRINPPQPTSLVNALQAFSKNPDSLKNVPVASLHTQLSAIFAAKAKRESVQGFDNIAVMPPMEGSFTEQEQSSNNEMMRISGTLIERMINLSGESAINRARIDMGMSSLTMSIDEMGTTVQRLADQLRRMEIELEQQILSQIDDADAELIANEGFDPLEMDQYSSLNQLSKSLTESASDLIDINTTLLEKTRDSENLLLQLSRTQTELQDGLMNSRIVPFARLTPRLERIVRQTANELNKSVELTIINADDEMDRTILERITSPLEHMLRNAVDHGIESPQVRMNAGKNRSGHIKLEVLREGSEVVINLTDDGRGINVDAVRNKAISQGLIAADDDSLSDLDVMQYIFNAGLTTTSEVTQISGRGVGMNVVISEVRQLGGVVSVTSEFGHGSCFTIRVPLTVAISDALVVRAADRYYAVPLVQIERVVRISPEKLYDYYQSDDTTMRIEDTDYRVRYLNDILTGNKLNELMVNTNTSLPVIIIKNRAGQNLALQVDQIAGSRIEVVVKPLGKQLSHLAGISAATIMGDGSVMMILDLIALLRNAPVIKDVSPALNAKANNALAQSDRQPTILVVDDSVTVRKVTSRFLERQGINAVVAKDGIDAIEVLQELTPDLILLDIEMPRMDGFEVAMQVRFNQRLRNIPIIMITSRTGEKHRDRAFEIGVNDYMGKPFQEKDLLDKIANLLGDKITITYDA